MVRAEQFAAAAERLVGARFKHRGRSTRLHDCVGAPFLAAAMCGLQTDPFTDYSETPDPTVLLREVARRCEPREWCEYLAPGRIVLLRQTGGGDVRHFAVSTGGGQIVHADADRGTVRRRLPERCELVHSVWLMRGVTP
jgi:cell wall-associated NlpC family hydrolase